MNNFEMYKMISQDLFKLRSDHTFSQSTGELRSDSSRFQTDLTERGFASFQIIVKLGQLWGCPKVETVFKVFLSS